MKPDNIVPPQISSIPFIGDLFSIDNGIFLKSAVKGKLSITGIEVQDNVFNLTVGLSSQVDLAAAQDVACSHVVVGLTVELPQPDGSALPATIVADVLQTCETVNLTPHLIVESLLVKILEYRLAPCSALAAVTPGPPPPPFPPMQHVEPFQQLQSLERQVAGQLDGKTGTRLRGDVKGRCEQRFLASANALRHLDSASWVFRLVSFSREVCKAREDYRDISRSLRDLEADRRGKATFVAKLREMGVEHVTDGRRFKEVTHNQRDAYVMFFCKAFMDSNSALFQKTFKFFDKLVRDLHAKGVDAAFAVVDLDEMPPGETGKTPVRAPLVRHTGRHRVHSWDLMKDMTSTKGLNLARLEQGEFEEGQPRRRAQLQMPCPGQGCAEAAKMWICQKCHNYLQYGFDDYLYCPCGKARVGSFVFKCSDYLHGDDYSAVGTECRRALDMLTPLKEVNVLLLGQSGVGKSTLVNGIVNYMMYDTLQVAEQSQVLHPISTKFTVTNNRYETKEVICGDDENEDKTTGASATQDCRVYSLVFEQCHVSLIDTPGLGDSRGIDQDRENVKKILDHLRQFELLHGICILLKPNESRIGVLLRFCVKEILSNLHKNCSRNIVYCFTNARSTFYKPGDTLPVLEKLLAEINVKETLHRDTMYCLDNESYRYLCTLKMKDMSYTEDESKSFSMSWAKSVEETKRLMRHVGSLPPHQTNETLTLNQARRVILSMTRPLADITHNIEINIAAVRDHQNMIENWTRSEQELMDNLFIPQVTLEQRKLDHPRTVCTNKTCVKYHTLPHSKTQVIEYVTHCHPHCYLQGVQPDCYPNADLVNCAAMSGTLSCIVCKCSWEKHMHIYYEQLRCEIKVKDQTVETELGSKKDARKAKEQTVRDMKHRVAELEAEQQKVIEITAKFAQFLKTNAITAYNDAFGDYLHYLIDQENSKPDKAAVDREALKRLQNTKKAYEEEVRVIEEAMQGTSQGGNFTPADVERWKEELYQLPVHGAQLQRAFTMTVAAEQSEARYNHRQVTAKPWLSSVVKGVKNFWPFRGQNSDQDTSQGRGWGGGQGRGRGSRQARGGRSYKNKRS